MTIVSSGKSERRTTTSTSLQLSALVATTVYAVKVTAINQAGKESSVVGKPGVTFETLVATPPSAPWGLTLIASTGGSIEVSWNVPLDSGGVPLDDILYNATLFSMAPCFQLDSASTGNDAGSDDPCASCRFVRLQASEQFELLVNGSSCQRPASSSCPDGTTSCCLTTANSRFGAGLLCSKLADHDRRYRLIVGSNSTVFQALAHSTLYFVGVKANNFVGSSAFSTIAGFQTTYGDASWSFGKDLVLRLTITLFVFLYMSIGTQRRLAFLDACARRTALGAPFSSAGTLLWYIVCFPRARMLLLHK